MSEIERLIAEARTTGRDPATWVAAQMLQQPYDRITPLQRDYAAQQIYYHQHKDNHGKNS